MPHYKSPTNKPHFLESADYEHLLPAGCAPISGEEAARLIAEAEALPINFIAKGQQYLDELAKSWGYDSIFTACTYAEEPAVPKFQLEGKALRKYRSEFWDAAHLLSPGPLDTVESLLAQLPPPPARPQ